MYLNLTSTPKIAPKGPKRAKKAPNLAKVKAKNRALLPKPKEIVYVSRLGNFFEHDPNPKNCPVSPTKSQKNPNGTELRMKRCSAHEY